MSLEFLGPALKMKIMTFLRHHHQPCLTPPQNPRHLYRQSLLKPPRISHKSQQLSLCPSLTHQQILTHLLKLTHLHKPTNPLKPTHSLKATLQLKPTHLHGPMFHLNLSFHLSHTTQCLPRVSYNLSIIQHHSLHPFHQALVSLNHLLSHGHHSQATMSKPKTF